MNHRLEDGYYSCRVDHVPCIVRYYKESDYFQIHNTRIIVDFDELEGLKKVDKPTWGTAYK